VKGRGCDHCGFWGGIEIGTQEVPQGKNLSTRTDLKGGGQGRKRGGKQISAGVRILKVAENCPVKKGTGFLCSDRSPQYDNQSRKDPSLEANSGNSNSDSLFKGKEKLNAAWETEEKRSPALSRFIEVLLVSAPVHELVTWMRQSVRWRERGNEGRRWKEGG